MRRSRPETSPPAGAPERRSFPRTPMPPVQEDNWCCLRTGAGESATAQVLDLTAEGCRLQIAANPDSVCLARLECGDWMEFQDWSSQTYHAPVDGLRAEVIWVEGRELGCRFERRLTLDELQGGAELAATRA